MSSRGPANSTAIGLALAVGAYGLWGFLPLYFSALAPAGPIEVVAWRVVLSLLFCAFLITVTRRWPGFTRIARERRTALTMGLAGALILVNWLVYVFAALNGHVVEAALGYFANPIVTVLLGVLVLRERLRPLQWAAVAITALAVLVLAVNYGQFPWIALALAFSFGFYGFIKKKVGGRVDAISGLTLETAWLAPVALAVLIVLGVQGTLVLGSEPALHTALLVSAGVVTAVPLLLFAAAARRLLLVHIGLTQFLAPVLQFALGVFLFQEEMPAARWFGFILVWIALVILTVDLLRGSRRGIAPESQG